MKTSARKQGDKRFRTMVQALREECPTTMGLPVSVRRQNRTSTFFGWVVLRKGQKSFLIVLCTNIRDKVTGKARPVTHGELQETLIHEWAHAMSWTPDHHSVTCHDAAWGVNYAKAYSAVVED